MALTLEAREVLFHLNYMGYRNISKEQLKGFMIGNLFLKIILFKTVSRFRLKKINKIRSQSARTTDK